MIAYSVTRSFTTAMEAAEEMATALGTPAAVKYVPPPISTFLVFLYDEDSDHKAVADLGAEVGLIVMHPTPEEDRAP